jgi:hypothetical protein
MFPCSSSLPALETLVILFCSNLKTIFYRQPNYVIPFSPLPKLLHFHDDVTFRFKTPMWEKLFVQGEYLKSKVEVSGECEWWDRLQLKLPEQSDYYMHVAVAKPR